MKGENRVRDLRIQGAYQIEPQNIEQGIEPATNTAGKCRRVKPKTS
jgi:hypothetical protein